jgi:hypothetical protein
MRGTHLGSSQHRPLDIEPEAGQIPENRCKGGSSGGRKQSPDVFQKDKSRSNSANDIRDGFPNPALVEDALALSCKAVGLARKAGRDPSNALSKLLGREGFE